MPAGAGTSIPPAPAGIHPMPPDWSTVLSGLKGTRLALYDDALRLGSIEVTGGTHRGQAWEDAARWLLEHRLLTVRDLDGYLGAVPLAQAHERYLKDGPVMKAPAWRHDAPVAQPQAEPAGRPAVQAHQAQFFDMEGYQ